MPEFPHSPDDVPENAGFDAEAYQTELADAGTPRHTPFKHTPTSYADLQRTIDAMTAPVSCGKQVSS